MRKFINSGIVILSILVMLGCSKSTDIQLTPEVTVFFSKNNEKSLKLTAKDNEYQLLQQWLQAHKTGWYATSGRYPGGVYIKSGDYGIQVTEAHVVIYSTTSEKPKAIYIQDLDKKELIEIRNIGQ